MTRDELIERVAREMHGDDRLWDTLSLRDKDRLRDDATRIVDLLSPVLEWTEIDGECRSDGYEIHPASSAFVLWYGSPEGADTHACRVGLFLALEDAQAAAQAHATAEWIATTKAAKEQAND